MSSYICEDERSMYKTSHKNLIMKTTKFITSNHLYFIAYSTFDPRFMASSYLSLYEYVKWEYLILVKSGFTILCVTC